MTTRKSFYNKKPELIKINGHEIILYKIKNETLLINCYIKNGFIFENKNNIGISHLLEHVITNAWKKCNYKECALYWGKKGVYYNAMTSSDGVIYTIKGIKKFMKDMLTYMVTIINNPKFINTNLKNEKEAVRTELLTGLNNKQYELYDTFNKNFYNIPGLRYRSDYIQQLKNLNKFTIDDLIRWYNEYYNKYIFYIIGDINKSELVKYLSKNLKDGSIHTSYIENCFSNCGKIYYVNESSSKQTNILWGFSSKIRQNSIEAIQISMICNLLKTILFKKLRTQLKLIYGIQISYFINDCGSGTSIFVNADNNKAKEVIKNIIELIKKYQKELCENSELTSYKNKFIYDYQNSTINNKKIWNFYGSQYFNQFNVDKKLVYSLNDLKKTISKIDRSEIRTFFNRIFDLNNSLLVYQSNRKII